MSKNGIKATQSKSVKSKEQIEIIATNNKNEECGEKHKSEGKKKKNHKEKTIPNKSNELELPSYPEICNDQKSVKRKKSKSKSLSITEDQGSKKEKNLTKDENPPENNQEDLCGALKKKKKKKIKPDHYTGPQTINEEINRNTCDVETSRVQNESKCHVKKMTKHVKHLNVEEGLMENTETLSGTPIKMTETPCNADNKSIKKKKRSHTGNIEMYEDEKSKKQKRDKHSTDLKTGNDQFIQADVRKQKDEQTVDNKINRTDKKYTKKKKKEKLHSKRHLLEPEHCEPSAVENERKGIEQIESATECTTKSKKKKRKRALSADKEEIEKLDKEKNKVDKTQNVCKLHNSPTKVTGEGEKQAKALSVPEESVKSKKKMKRKQKETSPGPQGFKVKEEQCESEDLQIMSEKKGNLFEVTIDKARRQALQEEVDRESSKTDIPETVPSEMKTLRTGTQWDTASFESVDQKNKFLRLMGGCKSSNQPPSTGHVSGKPNMALNKQEEQKFNSILQNEFDKALNFRQNQGTGLGFKASPGPIRTKTFFIDKHASKSHKFVFD
ncbi:lysine-rich nucleolar protein 1-like [Narcine bancroftii]|uniref:lysine-rich nucleolar protein 1-like n=1 Tax=Narcine bancroftii TaxID=1343680 RepID=UPI003831877E